MRYLTLILGLLVLSACYSGGRRGSDTSLAIYDFGPEVTSGASQWLGNRRIALEVKAPLWLDGMGIGYRLAYSEPNRLREFARSRWAGPPAQMVQQRLEQRLGLTRAGQGRADCVLRVEMTEFSQVFETPTRSFGVLLGKVVLFNRMRRPIGERPISLQQATESPDARGGVGALAKSVEQLATSLATWDVLKEAANATACGA